MHYRSLTDQAQIYFAVLKITSVLKINRQRFFNRISQYVLWKMYVIIHQLASTQGDIRDVGGQECRCRSRFTSNINLLIESTALWVYLCPLRFNMFRARIRDALISFLLVHPRNIWTAVKVVPYMPLCSDTMDHFLDVTEKNYL